MTARKTAIHNAAMTILDDFNVLCSFGLYLASLKCVTFDSKLHMEKAPLERR